MIPVFAPTLFMPEIGPFNPTQLITGAGGFWRADMGITLSGSNVTAAADQSSFGNNLGSSSAVVFSSTGFNSAKPGMTTADASFISLQGNLVFPSGSAASAFVLLEWNTVSNSGVQRIASYTGAGAAGDFNDPTSFTFFANSSTNPGLFINSTFVTGGTTAANGLYLYSFTFDGVNATIYQQTTQVGQHAYTHIPGTAGAGVFSLGVTSTSGALSTGVTYAFAGFTQRLLNGTDLTNLKTWSNTNWGTSF